MQYNSLTQFESEAQKAEVEASKAPEESATRAGWLHAANSWRLLAERAVTERTGGDISLFTSY